MTEEIRTILLKIFALAVMMFPLFATPFLIKMAGGLIGKVAGIVNNPNRGPIDSLRKKAEGEADRRRTNTARRAIEREQGYDPKTATRRQRAAHRARRLLPGGGAAAEAEREALINSAKKNLSSAREDFVAKRASDPEYQAALAGLSEGEAERARTSPGSNPQAARYLQRAEAVATETAAKAARERVSAFTTRYEESGADGADFSSDGFLEREYAAAVATGDADRAVAAINRMVALGASGKAAARRVLTTHAVGDQAVRDRVTKAVVQDNFNDLVGSHGDLVKGGAGFGASGQWEVHGDAAMGALSSELLATQDADTLAMYEADIPPAEAARIINDTQLSSKVKTQAALDILTRAASRTPPPPPSDIRLKRNIHATGNTLGLFNLPEYEYQYLWSNTTYIGVMAQDVLKVAPQAVCKINGFYHVYYNQLGTSLRTK